MRKTKPYSKDLREKVMEFVKNGDSQTEAALRFGVHYNTVNRWYLRLRKEGSVEARKRLGYKSKVNKEKLIKFVEGNANLGLKEIGKHFGISDRHSGRILKGLGFSYKKKRIPMWKQTK